jgi:20S proteasome alpha/beta subunit
MDFIVFHTYNYKYQYILEFMEQEELYGKLFDTIPLYSEEHLDLLLQTLSKDDASRVLIHAVKQAFRQNIYSLGECEVISKSIRVISRVEPEEKIEEQKKDGE